MCGGGGLMTKIIVRANKSVTLQHLGRAVKKRKKNMTNIKRLVLRTDRRREREKRKREDD